MIISRSMIIFAAFGIGLFLSALHFGGLWLTVRMLPRCKRPRLFFWSSYLGRYGITLWGFSQVMGYGPLPFVSAFLGFYLLRTFALANHCGMGLLEFARVKRSQWK
ncbi:ATP synthase subunit I [Maridesulfovibrio sp.]|uniref:ATP synthase subunit I n=1 Tax=Maridesulfovibrio sp. TaxID=2795000 RepID=UPI0029F4945C|nr:ATP synthase subunit I [Maridesulfovibrio sp.]